MKKVKTKDGYLDFKKRLKETQQGELVEYLEREEKGLATKDLDEKLDAIAEQRLANPDYYEGKKGKYHLFYPPEHEYIYIKTHPVIHQIYL